MIADYVPMFLVFLGVITYALEFWTGVAIAGWSGEQSVVYREKKPRQYWFVMILQTILLALFSFLVASA